MQIPNGIHSVAGTKALESRGAHRSAELNRLSDGTKSSDDRIIGSVLAELDVDSFVSLVRELDDHASAVCALHHIWELKNTKIHARTTFAHASWMMSKAVLSALKTAQLRLLTDAITGVMSEVRALREQERDGVAIARNYGPTSIDRIVGFIATSSDRELLSRLLSAGPRYLTVWQSDKITEQLARLATQAKKDFAAAA